MGSTVRLRLPSCGAFWFLRLVYFLSLLPVTPGAPEYWLFGPCAAVSFCFLTLHLGFFVCICVWPGESRSDSLLLYSLLLSWHLVKLA